MLGAGEPPGMTEPRVFVSHATADLDVVKDLFDSVRNLPVSLALAGEQVEPGRARRALEGQLRNSDLLVSVLTEVGAADPWVNQELGYAVAAGVPIVPLVDERTTVRGYLEGTEAVAYDAANPDVTAFNLISRLRSELEPLGSIAGADWYLCLPCASESCSDTVECEIADHQTDLWQRAESGDVLRTECETCGAGYAFDPATLAFLERTEPDDE